MFRVCQHLIVVYDCYILQVHSLSKVFNIPYKITARNTYNTLKVINVYPVLLYTLKYYPLNSRLTLTLQLKVQILNSSCKNQPPNLRALIEELQGEFCMHRK